MKLEPEFLSYLILLVTAFISGAFRWRRLSDADRWVCFLMLLTMIHELLAYLAASWFRNNLFTYHIYSPLELLVICLYFNDSIDVLKKWNGGMWIGITGVLISILNTLLLQPLSGFNTFYLLFEGLTVILLCMFSFYRILLEEGGSPLRQAHFWVTAYFLIYWSVTYASWGIYGMFEQMSEYIQWVNRVVVSSNLIFYAGITTLFFSYSKLKPSGE